MTDEDDIPPLEDIPQVKKEEAKSVSKQVQVQPTEKSFAGMKKGFLNSSSTSNGKSNELIEISRRTTEQTKDFRVLDEVQQAMKEEEQSKQIEDDESLSRYFANPYFMEAINLFQHKPQEALAKYGHNAEVMKFFDRMAKILGTHFTSMADQEDKQKQATIDPEVNQLLQDEQVRQLLLDPDVMNLMKMLREEPDKARTMRTANATMRRKIQQLVQLGLLNFA